MSPRAAAATGLRTLPHFRVQLANVYLFEAAIRRVNSPGAAVTDQPELAVESIQADLQDEKRTLIVVIQARLRYVYKADFRLELDCSVAGHFVAETAFLESDVASFVDNDALLIVYPHLRAHVSELARMSGNDVPFLPLLDVQALRGPESAPATAPKKPPRSSTLRKAALAKE